MNRDLLLADCDLAIITSPAALFYLSGFNQSDATIVITKEASYYVTNALYEIAVKTNVKKEFLVKILSRKERAQFLLSHIAAAKKVGVECEDMTLACYKTLFKDSSSEIVDLSPVLSKMRFIKTAEEIDRIKTAENIVDKAFSSVIPLLKAGVTERQIKDALDQSMIRNGAECPAFETIVAFGERAAMPHAVASDRELRFGDCVLMDFGAKYQGYCSDFTRTLAFGQPSEKFLKAYAVVLNAQTAAIDYLSKGGRSAKEADRIARNVVEQSDFSGKFNHTLGHGVGIQIHESPALSEGSCDLLTDGVVFTVEPGVYLEGEFGIRIESLCVIENGKLTVIDRSDKQIITV